MSIREYEENGKKYFEVYVNIKSRNNPRKRVQLRRIKIISRAKAEIVEKQTYEDAYRKMEKMESEGLLWGDIVEKWYLYEVENEMSTIEKITAEDYRNALKLWMPDVWDKPSKQITRGDVRNVIMRMVEAGKTKNYQLRIRRVINKVFTWAIEERLLKDVLQNPTDGIRIEKDKAEKKPEILTYSEMQNLLAHAKKLEHPWYPIWAVACLTGMRSGELYALEWSDVDFENKRIRVSKSYNTRMRGIKCTKAGYWRNVPMNEELFKLLEELKAKSDSSYVLPHFSDWKIGLQATVLRAFCIGVGLPSIKFHALRACFATQLLQKGVAPATVMKICGWRDLDTMARYIRYAGIDEAGATECLKILTPKEVMDDLPQLLTDKTAFLNKWLDGATCSV